MRQIPSVAALDDIKQSWGRIGINETCKCGHSFESHVHRDYDGERGWFDVLGGCLHTSPIGRREVCPCMTFDKDYSVQSPRAPGLDAGAQAQDGGKA